MSNSSIWLIDRTLSGATTLGQSGLGSDGNEEVLCILLSSKIKAGCIQDFRWVESYLSTEMQSMYSTAPANWAWEF